MPFFAPPIRKSAAKSPTAAPKPTSRSKARAPKTTTTSATTTPTTTTTTAALRSAPPAFLPTPWHAGIEIGAVDDPLEHQADRLADSVMRGPAGPTTTASALAPYSPRPHLAATPSGLGDTLGAGRPLDGEVRAFMEARFGRDLGGVRVHDGGGADAAARSIDARAFTLGRDVVFRSGEYAPSSPAGRRLLAHELAHTLQQEDGGLTRAARAHVIQRAPAAKTSPDAEALRGAMAYLSQISSTYVQVAGGKRRVDDSEVTSQINLMTGVYNKAEATMMGGPNPSGGVPQLRAAYQEALGNVVNASAHTTNRTANEIYLKHEAEIPEWAMPHTTDPKISTPLPLDARGDGRGHASMAFPGLKVVFAPDVRLPPGKTIPKLPNSDGETDFAFTSTVGGGKRKPTFNYKTDSNGILTSVTFTPALDLVLTITTTYLAAAKPSTESSAYGRGTTAEDVAAKDTSLRFHEGSHGIDYVKYLRENAFPALPSWAGKTPAQFQADVDAFNAAMNAYIDAMKDFSKGRTDCVGTPGDFCASSP